MTASDLSDRALRLWLACFSCGATLRFGGDGAASQLTQPSRAALNELLEVGAVDPIDADCSRPNREHYGAGRVDLRHHVQVRLDGHDVFAWLAAEPAPLFEAVP